MSRPSRRRPGTMEPVSDTTPSPAPTPRPVTVSCVSFEPVYGDKPATLERMAGWIASAAAEGADLVVFPEGALTSWTWCEGCHQAGGPCAWHVDEVAEPDDGPAVARVAELCAQHDLHVVFGFVERARTDADKPPRLHNSAAVVGPDGLVGTYRKVHLGDLPATTEGLTFTPGDALPVFELPFGTIGVSICFDFWFNPEIPRIQALKGAELLINPTATMPITKPSEIVAGALVRGRENLAFVAVSNLVGQPGDPNGDRFCGHSVITGPAYPSTCGVIAEGPDEPGLVTATVDLADRDAWAGYFPWREWRAGRLGGASALVAEEFAALRPPT
jgi:predicted amidohydrolase